MPNVTLLDAEIAAERGDEAEAQRLLDSLQNRVPRGRLQTRLATVIAQQGRLARARRDRQRAVRLHSEALRLFLETGHRPGIVQSLEDVAALRAEVGTATLAARMLGAARRARAAFGYARGPARQATYDADLAALRDALGSAQLAELMGQGSALSIEEAASSAVKGWDPKPRNLSDWDSLTRAERHVLGLVREGLSDREISDRLFVSPRTVGAHLTHVYAKIGVRGRAQLIAEATRHEQAAEDW
jgi:DNA-binding CsgD family transcriptional regulator